MNHNMTWRRILLIAVLLALTAGSYKAAQVRRRHHAKASMPPSEQHSSSEQQEVCQDAADRLKAQWPVLVNQLWQDPSGQMSAGFTYLGMDGQWHDCRLFTVP